MQLDKIFSTQFLDATTWLPLDSLTGVTISILEISEADGTTLSIPVNAQACINGGNGFYRYYYSGMQDKLYEYFINPNNANTVISSGWVDKRLNRLDSNVSDIRSGGGLSVNLSWVTGSINSLNKLVRDENEKLKEYITKEHNETNSHIDVAKTDVINTIDSIEIPEVDTKDIIKGIGTIKAQNTKLASYLKGEEDKEKEEMMKMHKKMMDDMEKAYEEMEKENQTIIWEKEKEKAEVMKSADEIIEDLENEVSIAWENAIKEIKTLLK